MKAWTYRTGCAAVDVRDRDRSGISDVPKRAAQLGMFSHHHRQLRSRGGSDSPANLILLLGSGTTGEHGWVHQHPVWATVLGLMVPRGTDPATVPVWRMDQFGLSRGWFLQNDDGTLTPCSPPAEHNQGVLQEALHQVKALALKSRITAFESL